MADVFISYKWDDKDKVHPLVEWLESKLGIDVWIDWTGVRSEDMFNLEIKGAIRECKVFIFMYSKAHEVIDDPNNNWPYREITFASYLKKPIMFVELEDCILDDQYIFEFPHRQVRHTNNSQEMDELVKDVRRLLNLPQPDPMKPTDTEGNKTKSVPHPQPNPSQQGKTTNTVSVPTGSAYQPQSEGPTVTSKLHPQAIDLGLPSGTKWASFNVGATKPEECGGYYAWGETKEKKTYNWNTYDYCDGGDYCNVDEVYCFYLGSDISGTIYDVAHVKWGGNWRMPTIEQFEELLSNCHCTWTKQNGVNGRKFISKHNGKSIFLPAAGCRGGDLIFEVDTSGSYWSSTQVPSFSYFAHYFAFSSGFLHTFFCESFRDCGRPVRPVSMN